MALRPGTDSLPLFVPPDQTSRESLIRNLLRRWAELLQNPSAVDPQEALYLQSRLGMLALVDPNAVSQIAEEFGLRSEDVVGQNPEDTVGGFLESLGIPSNVASNLARNIITTFTSNVTTVQRARRYVDVPTPEEFLNDFETGVRGFLSDLVRSGQLDFSDAQLMLDPATGVLDTLLDQYLGELASRASQGEDIFEVVGVEGTPQRLGEREGRVTETEAQIERETKLEQRQTEGVSQVIGGEQVSTQQQQTLAQQQKETGVQKEQFQETEEIFRRPNIAITFKLSPLDFLKREYSDPGKLATFVRAIKGRRQRQRQTLTGGPISRVTRIG